MNIILLILSILLILASIVLEIMYHTGIGNAGTWDFPYYHDAAVTCALVAIAICVLWLAIKKNN